MSAFVLDRKPFKFAEMMSNKHIVKSLKLHWYLDNERKYIQRLRSLFKVIEIITQ